MKLFFGGKRNPTLQDEIAHLQLLHDSENPVPKDDDSNWLVSYADMMTLLCGFFIMLFSMAKIDSPKYDRFKEAMSKQFGVRYDPPSRELAKSINKVVKESDLDKSVNIKSDASGVSITFESTVFFDTLSADVTRAGKVAMNKLIEVILIEQKKSAQEYRIVVEGHTDSRPIVGGSFPSNWELSGARAARVVRMFLAAGFVPNRLTGIGYADTQPQVEARLKDGKLDDQALAKNRRVVIRILESRVDSIPFPEGVVTASNRNLATDLSSPRPSSTPSSSPAPAPSLNMIVLTSMPLPKENDVSSASPTPSPLSISSQKPSEDPKNSLTPVLQPSPLPRPSNHPNPTLSPLPKSKFFITPSSGKKSQNPPEKIKQHQVKTKSNKTN